MSLIWQSWRMQEECEPESISEQVREEAIRAVRDFRSSNRVMWGSGKFPPEMVRDVRVNQHQFTRESVAMPPIFDLEAESDVRVAQIRWHPWYDHILNQAVHRPRHEEPLPPWDSRWVNLGSEK